MAKQNIDIGVEGNDGTGDSVREAFRKVNENFGELYAVFGIGGQISFTDLSDTPSSYEGNENNVPTVRSDGSGMNLLELASDNALDGSADTIGFDFTVDGKLIVKQLVSKLSNDPQPTLSGPMDGATQPIANITVSQSAIDTFNSVHGTNLTIDKLVIDKAYADRNYQSKDVAGGGLRLPDEPADASGYTLSTTNLNLGNLQIPNHGLDEAFNGAPFTYTTTGTDPSGLTNGNTYYVRIVDGNNISLHPTENDATGGTARILLAGGSGTFTIVDNAYDPDLDGNWLSNVAIPRKSAVRRQGDSMAGALNLFDHPGDLAGKGLPNGIDDLQAATKLYVDNVASQSQVNLYVSMAGDDKQTFTPAGRQGRSPGYAYRTINAACEKAEEIILSSGFEPGPYMQTMTFNTGEGTSKISTAGIQSPISGRTNARSLIIQNKEFIAKEVTGYINATFPNFVGRYNEETCQRDVQLILDSVSLDALLGNNANYLSRYAGIQYYSNVSGQIAIGAQRTETVAGITYARDIVRDYILTNTAVPTTYQSRVPQFIEPAIVPDAQADNAIAAKFDIVLQVIADGPLNAPTIVDGSTRYKINATNGNFGFVDQANPQNTDIIPGKVIRGKNSGAIGRIVDYKYEADPDTNVSVAGTDEIEVQLLEPIEFEDGEELEYGNIVNDTQISVRIESGIYEEDLPIRVPANVSIKGDEFRRVIVRPRDRVSQSRYANIFFYRDAEFDNLVLGKSNITSVNFTASTDASRSAGTYAVTPTDYTTNKLGQDAEFSIVVDGTGAVTNVTVTNEGDQWQVGETITVRDSALGNGGATDYSFTIATVPNGVQYINQLTGNVDGYFGHHYLLKPDKLKNVGAGYTNVGNWETAALVLIDNKEFIQEQVVNFVETTYPALVGSAVYGRVKCSRDTGLIVDALVKDLRNGSNEFALEAQGEYYAGAVKAGSETETVAGIQYIYTLANKLIAGEAPTTFYGPAGATPVQPGAVGENLEYWYDLFNGDAKPTAWSAGKTYNLQSVVYFNDAGTDRYYQPKAEHTSGSVFDATEVATYWIEIDGPDTVIQNLIDTVKFAFNSEYNPPLRNDQMDVFLMNDATILRNITGQGHGGFQMALDPEGQVLTKSPYCQTGTGFAKSDNKQVFRGGLLVDAFVGNSAMRVTSKVDGSAFRLNVQSLGSQTEPQGLFVRKPETPSVFYLDGRRFQVNAVTNYDPAFGTATLILSPGSNSGTGFTGITSSLGTGLNLDDLSSPIGITLQTAGNRSMLGNDFTQINDKGYGLVAVNGALSEMVSMFTYYCHSSYYAKNGSEIRSLTGSSCYGEFGLVAEGSDPNEIPDSIGLEQDMVQAARTFDADVILEFTNPVIVQAGDVLTQLVTGATGTVSSNPSQLEDSSVTIIGRRTIYLTSTTGAFNTTNELQITGPIVGDSTVTGLGADSVPLRVNSTGYGNNKENLFLHAYDFKDTPSNRSEFDIYHPSVPAFARYEVANVSKTDVFVGNFPNVGTEIPYTQTVTDGTATGALFTIRKTQRYGYQVVLQNGGANYTIGDTFTVAGTQLGGGTPDNDAFVTVDAVNSGVITSLSVNGSIFIEDDTPMFDGEVLKLNFSTSDASFSTSGLLADVGFDVKINYRRNQTHVINDLARPDVLTIRPSTALIFKENPDFVYRSISFLPSDSLGNELGDNILQAGFDSTYDYVKLIVNSAKASETVLSGAGHTKGATIGDTVIAVTATLDQNEINRLNNNSLTPASNRPVAFTDELQQPMMMSWNGKTHYIYNYRGVDSNDQIVAPAEDNAYGIVDIIDIDSINEGDFIDNGEYLTTGLSQSIVLGSEIVTIRAGLQAGALGDVTVNISTCRATSHDFLDVGTGGFNESNYPNVIFGEPAEKKQSNEVQERGKGRVFYVSTDQNGIFRVGRFFSVDQGTGTVTFSASLALSDVDGIGFKRGVVVTEFSTDTAMTDNAADTVPTELAVRGYVNRRLGYDVNGAPVANKLGPGVLAPNGAVPMTDDLNAAGNTITNIKTPVSDSDAANKSYVDAGRGNNDEIKDLRSVTYDTTRVTEGQFIVSTEYKKLIVDAGSIVSGPYERGDTITGTITGATGTVVDVIERVGVEGNIVEIVYTPVSGEFSDGKPSGASPDPDVIAVIGGAEATCIDGPVDEFANATLNPASDILIDTNRESSDLYATDRYTTLNFQINSNSIVNSDINGAANISQSKLNMNVASTRADAVGITQNDLGLTAFDSATFDVTNGWVTIPDGSIGLQKFQRIQDQHVLGNYSGDSSSNDIDEIPFSTVISEGGGLVDDDFTSIIGAAADPGNALIETGTGTYAKSNVSSTGEVNSIIKSDANGSIQVNSVILGGDPTYEVLALDTTTVLMKTPAQGEIFRAVGGNGGATPSYPELQIAGSVDISQTGTSQSVLQAASNFNGEKVLGVDWIYSSFIEAPGEKGAASTAVAIGANTGKTTAGQVAIITADGGTNSSVVPMLFASTGMTPDTDNTYDIGSATYKYKDVYATLFRGTATESYYADLAENYTADAQYEPGTVVVFGGEAEVTVCSAKGDTKVAGVISTNPAHLMNSHLEGDNIVELALQGRVPCKVIGPVQKGDMLVTSAVPGYAIVDNQAGVGTVIGKALEAKTDGDRGVIEIVVGKH